MKRVSKRDRELMEKWIELDPRKPWEGEARIDTIGAHVWVLMGRMEANDGDLGAVAREYHLPLEAIEAAYAYYRLHRHAVDARLAIEDAALEANFPTS